MIIIIGAESIIFIASTVVHRLPNWERARKRASIGVPHYSGIVCHRIDFVAMAYYLPYHNLQ